VPHVRTYLNRRWTLREIARVDTARLAARTLSTVTGGDVAIRLQNKRNPNGFEITAKTNGVDRAERFVNMGWAKRKGYTT
jgi:hypothetical protein